MKKLLYFDFDGVISDSAEYIFQGWANFFGQRSIVYERETLLTFFDGNFWETFRSLGFAKEDEPLLHAEVEKQIIKAQNFPLFKSFIPDLAQKYELFIVSSNAEEHIKQKLMEDDLLNYFYDVYGLESPGNKKDKIRKIESRFPGQVSHFFVTDTVGDILEAKSAGLPTIAVTWGAHPRERFIPHEPDFICEKPEELLEILVPKEL